jgi:hypothetical protein
MEDENIVNADTSNGEEELDLDLSNDTEEDTKSDDDVATLKEQNKKLFARAKKAEGFEFKDGKWVKPVVEKKPEPKAEAPLQELSAKDALLLAKADVDLEDVDEVVDFAKYRKITIAEALQNPTLKAILTDSQEKRKTALATQTSGPRKTTTPSLEALTEKAKKGELSESEIDKLVALRMEAKLKKS